MEKIKKNYVVVIIEEGEHKLVDKAFSESLKIGGLKVESITRIKENEDIENISQQCRKLFYNS